MSWNDNDEPEYETSWEYRRLERSIHYLDSRISTVVVCSVLTILTGFALILLFTAEFSARINQLDQKIQIKELRK